MPMMSQPAFGPKLAIGFITGGALLDVWTLVWRYTVAPSELSDSQRFWYMGLLLTGLTFLTIGAFLGSIGRAARKAELPPEGKATNAEAAIQANAAANPNPGVAGAVMAPGMVAPGMVAPGMVPGMAAPMAPPATVVPPTVPGQVAPGLAR